MILKLAANRLNIHKTKKIEASLQRKSQVGDMLAGGRREQARIMVSTPASMPARVISGYFNDHMSAYFILHRQQL